VTGAQGLAIAALALPALAFVLWPLLRRSRRVPPVMLTAADHRRLELSEEKAAIYRSLRELAFEREAGHLSEADYQALYQASEARAAELLGELDKLGPALPAPPPAPPRHRRPPDVVEVDAASAGGGWTRHPAAIAGGALVLLVFGVIVGLGASRFTAPDEMATSPGSRVPVPIAPGGGAVSGAPSDQSGRAVPPEVLAGMLRAARQSLAEQRYQEAIAAYQAVLKRDPRNVDAMTHLGVIVAMGGHADTALATFARALDIDPAYAPALLYRGQVLYEVKRDYPGALEAWQRYLELVPRGAEHDRVKGLVEEARAKQRGG
jgi:tetratricopeptide (TPR) repeat protein